MPHNVKKSALVLAGIILISALVLIVLQRRDRGGDLNLDPLTAAGEVIADETAALLGGQGKVVLVTFDTSATEMPAAKAVRTGFQQRMKGQGGITVLFETLKVNPSPGMALWSLSQYQQLVQRHPGADAIVSLLGPPFFTEAEVSSLPQELPKGVVFGGGNPGQPLRKLFERGVVQVAVVNRFTPLQPGSATPAATGRDRFEQQFQIIRTHNASILPY